MPEAVTDNRMDRDGEIGQGASSSYQVYSTDDFGSLRVSCPPEEGRILLAKPRKKKHAVHKMARGTLKDGTDVLALARHNGEIDIVSCQEGKLLTFFHPSGMRENIHRWVGLAVAPDGIYSCTSAGSFLFTALETASGRLTEGTSKKIELPEPLMAVAFEPLSNPKYFAYGGEEVPLSVWEISKALSTPPSSPEPEEEDESNEGGSSQLSGKQRKRKRAAEKRSKEKDLKWGEIWRARNLPNDAVNLAQNSCIISIVFVEEKKIVTGHRMGSVRLFQVGPQRKAIKEVKLFHPKIAPVKHLVKSHNDGELVAADITGRVYVVNWRSGTIQYKYEIFTGAAISLCALPPSQGSITGSRLVTASTEKLLRMHDMPVSHDLIRKNKENGKIRSTKFYEDGVSNVVWDGVIPQAGPEERAGGGNGEQGGSSSHVIDVDAEEDDIWERMAPIEDESDEAEHRTQRRRISTET